MSRVRTEVQKSSVNHGSIGRRVGEDPTGWRCFGCSFHNTGETCNMCGEPRPKVVKPLKPNKNPNKPRPAGKVEESKQKKPTTDVYYDKTDGSFNVPIAGIKKYDHKPGKNNIVSPPKEEKKAPTSNIVTLDQVKAKKMNEPRKIDGKRDLLGLLQDAATDEPLPCMRKNQKPKNINK